MQTWSSGTALVVEPDELDRGRLRHLLAADGYEALAARDARAAFDLAVHRPPEVVLVNLELPGRDAAALTRRIRALPTTRQATIIAVADPRALDEVGGVMAAGVDDFLAKPFGRPELHERIESVARTRAMSFAAEAPEAVVAALANAVAVSHPATGSHSQRVARLAGQGVLVAEQGDQGVQGAKREVSSESPVRAPTLLG
jgi:DNA-binding response OmpR family regulator